MTVSLVTGGRIRSAVAGNGHRALSVRRARAGTMLKAIALIAGPTVLYIALGVLRRVLF